MEILNVEPVLNIVDMARFMGARRGHRLSHGVKASVESLKIKINQLVEPKIVFNVLGVKDVSNGGVRLKTDCLLKSPKLSKTLSSSREAVCFLATIGSRIEKEIRHLFQQKRFSKAYILDAMGSAVVENIVDRFQERMRKRYKVRGKTVTLRFSPGYCDWSINEQKKLFRLLEPERIGVELTDSCLMTPRKSISGIFGIQFNGEKEQPLYNPCTECKKTDCRERRAPQAERLYE